MSRSHIIDIGGLLAGSRQHMLLTDAVSLEPFEGIQFPEPARVHLELQCVDRLLHIEGTVDVRAHGECDSCLEGVDREVHVDVDERFDPSLTRDDDPFGESNVMTGDRLDVADLVQQLVLTILPMGLRCSEDCKGLCAVCGANKNAGACSCDNGDFRGKSKMENTAQ